MSKHNHLPGQLGFDDLLSEAKEQNRLREFERETAHLPATMEEALPFFRSLLEKHHAAMLEADTELVFELREEARTLALRLGGGDPGILANSVAPACVLTRLTTAPAGDVPLWGQAGEFVIDVAGVRARMVIDGLFGLGSSCLFWPGLAAHCTDTDKPFISETGYRRFIGMGADVVEGMTPASFACAVVDSFIDLELKGKLVAVNREYLSEDA